MGISPQQFQQLQARVQGARPRPEDVGTATSFVNPTRHAVVLGIDPSLRGTGWGVIRRNREGGTALGWGCIQCPRSLPRTQCLLRIAGILREAIQKHAPTACAIEGLFFAQNLQTALLLGEARGVCLLAAAEAGLEICEIAPRKVKLAVVGYGGAQKIAVARMVQRRLGLAEAPQADAADALALALTHAQEGSRFSLQPRRQL
jgi:crossover junction endodeoxyribonuclease RuvC